MRVANFSKVLVSVLSIVKFLIPIIKGAGYGRWGTDQIFFNFGYERSNILNFGSFRPVLGFETQIRCDHVQTEIRGTESSDVSRRLRVFYFIFRTALASEKRGGHNRFDRKKKKEKIVLFTYINLSITIDVHTITSIYMHIILCRSGYGTKIVSTRCRRRR